MQLFFFVNHKALGRRGTETAKLLQSPPNLAYIVLSLKYVGRVGEANPGRGFRKTPELGLVEDRETLRKACTNNELRMRMPHVAPSP